MDQKTNLVLIMICVLGNVRAKKGVFHPPHNGHNTVNNIEDANAVCKENGARIATLIELKKHRFDLLKWTCGCGWLYKGKIYDPGCGEDRILTKCSKDPADYGEKGFDVYCFGNLPEIPPGVPVGAFNIGTGFLFQAESNLGRYHVRNVNEGKLVCRQNGGSIIAKPRHIEEAHDRGFEYCSCGWVSDGTVLLPMHKKVPGCGSENKINRCPTDYMAWRRWGWGEGWNVFCYKKHAST